MTDYTTLTDDELTQIFMAVEMERARRRILTEAADRLDSIITETITVGLGRKPGEAWVPPTGAHDAYPRGWTVTHDGTLYESLIPANTTVPGSDPRWWRDLTPEPETDGPPEWKPGLTLAGGDLITHQGQTYRVRQAHTTQADWTPAAVPALYERLPS